MRFSVWLVAAGLTLSTACTTPRTEASAPIFPSPAPASSMPAPPPLARPARVVRVVDGDTVVLDGISSGEADARTGGHRARLIGIDTPEAHGDITCLGREASAYTQHALLGKAVLVEFDVDAVDRYGRALVYLWTSNRTFFNGKIVADGYAVPMTVPPNVRYAELFVRLAERARAAQRGLWSLC